MPPRSHVPGGYSPDRCTPMPSRAETPGTGRGRRQRSGRGPPPYPTGSFPPFPPPTHAEGSPPPGPPGGRLPGTPFPGPRPPEAPSPRGSGPCLPGSPGSRRRHRGFEEEEPSPRVDPRTDAERQRKVRTGVAGGEPVPDGHGKTLSYGGEELPDLLLPPLVHRSDLPCDDARDLPQPAGLDPLREHPVDPVRRLPDILQEEERPTEVGLVRRPQQRREDGETPSGQDPFRAPPAQPLARRPPWLPGSNVSPHEPDEGVQRPPVGPPPQVRRGHRAVDCGKTPSGGDVGKDRRHVAVPDQEPGARRGLLPVDEREEPGRAVSSAGGHDAPCLGKRERPLHPRRPVEVIPGQIPVPLEQTFRGLGNEPRSREAGKPPGKPFRVHGARQGDDRDHVTFPERSGPHLTHHATFFGFRATNAHSSHHMTNQGRNR